MEYSIDCACFQDKADFHRTIARELNFPQWYGHNLDALHDCLTALSEDTCITLRNWAALEEKLGFYANSIRRAMTHAESQNPNLRLSFQ